MQQPLWKKWLSHIKELSLEQTGSNYNPHLEVLLVRGRHQLVTEDAIYSFDDKYLNFDYAFKKIDWTKFKRKQALVLGLGLGSVILLLEKKYKQQFDYVAVEIDPEICRLCNKYTLSELDSYVEVLPTEATNFLHTREETYDLVIMDIFQSGDIPLQFQSEAYLSLLKDKLSPDGLLLYNRMNISSSHKRENKAFEPVFNKVFSKSSTLHIQDNIICVNDSQYLR